MSKKTREYYISIDIEADGPCPGINSMLQFGAVFYDFNGKVLGEYSANIYEIEGAVQDPGTMAWWAEQETLRPGIWASMMENRVTAEVAMKGFDEMVRRISAEIKASPTVIAYPAGYDFTWTYWYLCKFVGSSCVGFSALDMKTLGMALIQRSYHDAAKKRFPRHWFNPEFKHTHNALEDARGQGYTFFMMRRDLYDVWSLRLWKGVE